MHSFSLITHYTTIIIYLHSMWHGISVFHCPARLGISSECSQSDIQRLEAIRHDRSLLVQVNLSVNTMKCLVVLLRDCCFYDKSALDGGRKFKILRFRSRQKTILKRHPNCHARETVVYSTSAFMCMT